MPRRKANSKQILELLKRGMNDFDTARSIGDISHDTVRRYRIKFAKEGLLPAFECSRKPRRRNPVSVEDAYTWTAIQEALLRSLQQAAECERLHAENIQLTKKVSVLSDQLESTEQALKKAVRSDQEWHLRIQRGDIPMPLFVKK